MQLRNRSAEPEHILDCKIAGLFGDVWQSPCRVAFLPNPPYYLSARATAREVILSRPRFGDGWWRNRAWSKRNILERLDLPAECNLAAARLRLTVTDANARSEMIGFSSRGEASGKAFDISPGVDIGGALSLDPVKATLYSRDRCAHPLRQRHAAGRLW